MSKLDNKYFAVNGLQRANWYMTYQPLDVDTEIRKMVAWLDANPKRRKSNYQRFIVNWLNKAHASVVKAAVEARHTNIVRQAEYRDQQGNRYKVTAEGTRQYL